jgi:hypothetical protein
MATDGNSRVVEMNQFLEQEDLLLQQPDLAGASLTAPGATVPVAGQTFWHSALSLTAPGLALAPEHLLAHSVAQDFSPTAPMLALSQHFVEQFVPHSPTAPGATELVLVVLQPTKATRVQTAIRLRTVFMI